jgi:hypothetical protein
MKWNLKSTSHWAIRAMTSLAITIPINQSLCKNDDKDNKENELHDVSVYLSAESRNTLKSHLGNASFQF